MKILSVFGLCILLLASCDKDENYNDKYGDKAVIPYLGRNIRVMSYNILSGYAEQFRDKPYTLETAKRAMDALAEVIRRQDPDFVILNEVDNGSERTAKVHQAREIAERLGMEWHYTSANTNHYNGEFGEAVLSKFPILERLSYILPYEEVPGGPKLETRALCVIRVEIDGQSFFVAGTHLDHRYYENSRILQVNTIRGLYDTELAGNMILAGDLNAVPSAESMITLSSFMKQAGPVDALSYPSDKPDRKIDYIFYNPSSVFTVLNYKVVSLEDQQVNGLDVSDHRPIVADIRIKTEKED